MKKKKIKPISREEFLSRARPKTKELQATFSVSLGSDDKIDSLIHGNGRDIIEMLSTVGLGNPAYGDVMIATVAMMMREQGYPNLWIALNSIVLKTNQEHEKKQSKG